jgi:hypothetical protein
MYTKNNKFNIPLFIMDVFESNIAFNVSNSNIILINNNKKIYSRYINRSLFGIILYNTHNVHKK